MSSSRVQLRGRALPISAALLVLAISQTRCAAELEDPERFGAAASSPIVVDCNYAPIIGERCALAGCHSAPVQSGLNLVPDGGLAARLKDKPPIHGGFDCDPNDAAPECPPALIPTVCTPGAKLVDSQNPSASWILVKLTAMQGSCGVAMPGHPELNSDEGACFVKMVNAIAAL